MSATSGPLLPTGPADANRALIALERGDWRTARSLADRIGRIGIPVRLLAISMGQRTYGLVPESWTALALAANQCSAHHLPAAASRGPGDPAPLPWPADAGSELWHRLVLVGRREEDHARAQWQRIESAVYPKRTAVIESCVDHLIWVSFDVHTWQQPSVQEWRPSNDRVTRGKLGESGREYFLRRSNELYHSVFPTSGSLGKKVWEDLGHYRGVHEAALIALAARESQRIPEQSQRVAYTKAVENARPWLNR